MKMNKTGLYEILEGGMFIKDTETGEKMFFLLDPDKKVVIRSMIEEDIKPTVTKMDLFHSAKRKKIKELANEIVKEGSEKNFFVAEKILETENVSYLYENKRKIIGYGKRIPQNIEIEVFEDKEATNIMRVLNTLGNYFGIKGNPYIIPAN